MRRCQIDSCKLVLEKIVSERKRKTHYIDNSDLYLNYIPMFEIASTIAMIDIQIGIIALIYLMFKH